MRCHQDETKLINVHFILDGENVHAVLKVVDCYFQQLL